MLVLFSGFGWWFVVDFRLWGACGLRVVGVFVLGFLAIGVV